MSIKIIKPGICSTVQDLGRTGYRSLGVGPGGVMDFFAAALADYLVGNNEKQPVIEMHFPAAEILFQVDVLLSVTGGNFEAHIDHEPIEMYQPIFVQKGSVLSFRKQVSGARVYLAIYGVMETENWLGSYSTHLKAIAGGFKGRIFKKDDTISITDTNVKKNSQKFFISPGVIGSIYNNPYTIRCISGPEWNFMGSPTEQIFLQSPFVITNQSDRMGYRLAGENLSLQNPIELISSPVNFGTIQILPNGQIIILMADHQTTGGYPRVATVIAADLPKLAQLQVNDKIYFQLVSFAAAEEMLISIHKTLSEIKSGCQKFYEKH
ncbi:MAG: biotin-dependent carboxyltransferase family protein [Ferruginibacter sp.]